MGEQQRVATARALTVQETSTALVAVLDDRVERLCVEDGAMALGFAVATYAAANGRSDEEVQALLVRVLGTAQAAVKAVRTEKA